jgi:hypothetical protein
MFPANTTIRPAVSDRPKGAVEILGPCHNGPGCSDMQSSGLVAKDPASPYVGGRTLRWLKVKQPHYREGERGWEPQGKS